MRSSLSSERESVPFFRYGPYRPFCVVMSTPVSGSCPTTRGSESSLSAVSRSTVCGSIDLKRDAVLGFTAGVFLTAFRFGVVTSPVFGSTTGAGSGWGSGSGRTSVTYGP